MPLLYSLVKSWFSSKPHGFDHRVQDRWSIVTRLRTHPLDPFSRSMLTHISYTIWAQATFVASMLRLLNVAK